MEAFCFMEISLSSDWRYADATVEGVTIINVLCRLRKGKKEKLKRSDPQIWRPYNRAPFGRPWDS